jgi:hypothetical protein
MEVFSLLRKLIFLQMLLSFSSIMGQITVLAHSSIYVKDEVLTVTGDINLVSSTSKIYLRDEAQLIQKEESSINQGQGILSVYQNNNVHEYAFNFWCAPVGNTSLSNTNNPFRASQIHDPLLNTPSTTDSQPALFTTGGQGLSTPLTIAKSWLNIFQAGSALSSWSYVGDTGNILPGLGFTMKGTAGSNSNQTYDFRGKPNSGTISNTVLDSQWTLIGNPYPSALDALAFIHDLDNVDAITGTLYFWQQDLAVLSHNILDYVGGYASYTITQDGAIETFIPAPFNTYNSNGTINNNGNPLSNLTTQSVRRYLPIGQGFMVEGKTGTSGLVKTKNSHRVYYKESQPESEFFRTADVDSYATQDYSRFRLNIDFNNIYTRQLVQTFSTNATAGFDYGLESKSTNPLANDAHWLQQNLAYTSQASFFDSSLILPLQINLASNSMMRFRMVEQENFDENQPVFLYDNETNLCYDLTNEMPEIHLLAGHYHNRFDIRFTSPCSLNLDTTDSMGNFNLFYAKNDHELVLINRDNFYINTLDLFDISGKLVLSEPINSDSDVIKTALHSMAQGMYIAIVKSNELTHKSKLMIH